MKLSEYLRAYELCRDVTADYIEQLAIACKRLEQFAGRSLEMSDLNDDLVNRWIIHVQTTQARITAKDKRRGLLTLWYAAADEGLCDPPKRIRPVKLPERVIEGWSAAEATRLLQTSLTMTGNQRKVKIPKPLYWSSFIMAAWDSAMRLGDVLGLERDTIRLAEDGSGLFTRIMGKTGRAIRLRLRPETMEAIDASMAHGGPRRLIWPLGGFREAWYRQFKRLVARAGLTGTSRYIRRGAASEAEAIHPGAGPRLLGHRDRGETFQRHYCVDKIVVADMPLPPSIALTPAGESVGAA